MGGLRGHWGRVLRIATHVLTVYTVLSTDYAAPLRGDGAHLSFRQLLCLSVQCTRLYFTPGEREFRVRVTAARFSFEPFVRASQLQRRHIQEIAFEVVLPILHTSLLYRNSDQ